MRRSGKARPALVLVAMLAMLIGISTPATAEGVVLSNQLAPIDGELVWCDLMVYDEDNNEIEVCILHDDDHDDGDDD